MSMFVVFCLLFAKHFLADFVLQTPRMIQEKGIYGKLWGVLHSLIHGVFTTAVFVIWTTGGLAVAVMLGILDFLIHYHIDWAKHQISKMTSLYSRGWWMLMGLDQLLHYLTYLAMIFWFFIVRT